MAIMFTLTEDELNALLSAKQQLDMVVEVMGMVSGSPTIGLAGVTEFMDAQRLALDRVLTEVEERGPMDRPKPPATPARPRKRERLAQAAMRA